MLADHLPASGCRACPRRAENGVRLRTISRAASWPRPRHRPAGRTWLARASWPSGCRAEISPGAARQCDAHRRILVALILAFGPVSGAHLNPAVTLASRPGGLPWSEVPGYVLAQCAGAFAGVVLAHSMFELPPFTRRDVRPERHRAGPQRGRGDLRTAQRHLGALRPRPGRAGGLPCPSSPGPTGSRPRPPLPIPRLRWPAASQRPSQASQSIMCPVLSLPNSPERS